MRFILTLGEISPGQAELPRKDYRACQFGLGETQALVMQQWGGVVHGSNEGKPMGFTSQLGKEFRDLHARHAGLHGFEGTTDVAGGFRLGVKRVQLGDSAYHQKQNAALLRPARLWQASALSVPCGHCQRRSPDEFPPPHGY